MRTKATSELQARRKTTRLCGEHWRVMSLFVDEDFLPPPVAFSEVRNRIGRGGVQSFGGSGAILTFFLQQEKSEGWRRAKILPMPVPIPEVRNRVGTGGR